MMTVQTSPAAPASPEILPDSLVWFRNKGGDSWSLGQFYYYSNAYRRPVVTCLVGSTHRIHLCVDEVRPVDLGSQSREVWDWILNAIRRAEVAAVANIKQLVAEA